MGSPDRAPLRDSKLMLREGSRLVIELADGREDCPNPKPSIRKLKTSNPRLKGGAGEP